MRERRLDGSWVREDLLFLVHVGQHYRPALVRGDVDGRRMSARAASLVRSSWMRSSRGMTDSESFTAPHKEKLKEVPIVDKAFPPTWAEDHLGGGGGFIRTERRSVLEELPDDVPLDEVLPSDEGRLDTVGGGDIHGADVTMNGERRRSVNGFAVCTDAEFAVSAARFAVGAVRVE